MKQQEQFENRGEEGRGGRGDQPSLIGGDSIEARAVCLALEQCLFHGIRVKEFGEDVDSAPDDDGSILCSRFVLLVLK